MNSLNAIRALSMSCMCVLLSTSALAAPPDRSESLPGWGTFQDAGREFQDIHDSLTVGACCHKDYEMYNGPGGWNDAWGCKALTKDQCDAINGEWAGAGVTCDERECFMGACCWDINNDGEYNCQWSDEESCGNYSRMDMPAIFHPGESCEDVDCPDDSNDGSHDPIPWESREDLNRDGIVDIIDVLEVLENFGKESPNAPSGQPSRQPQRGDVNRDGRVGLPDLLRVVGNWGNVGA